MADYTKREQSRADIHHMIEAGIGPPKFPMPRCECGEPATIAAYTKRGVFHFCAEHADEAVGFLFDQQDAERAADGAVLAVWGRHLLQRCRHEIVIFGNAQQLHARLFRN